MLTSVLRPVVHGGRPQSQRRAWLMLATIHSAGLVISAAMMGTALAALAMWTTRSGVQPWSWGLRGVAFLSFLYLPRQMGWTSFPPLLQSTRQVPQAWTFNRRAWVTALLFGLGLGSGCYTRIVVPTFYLLLVWPFLFSGFFWPIVIWGIYGLARASFVWWLACVSTEHDLPPRAFELVLALRRYSHLMHRTHAVILLMVAAWLTVWSLSR